MAPDRVDPVDREVRAQGQVDPEGREALAARVSRPLTDSALAVLRLEPAHQGAKVHLEHRGPRAVVAEGGAGPVVAVADAAHSRASCSRRRPPSSVSSRSS